MSNYTINHLKELESEAIFVIREIAAQFENPVLLFSGGKDSILLTHLAKKAFYPAKIPFPLIHVDTGHNFPETISFRDALVEKLGVKLIVGVFIKCARAWKRGRALSPKTKIIGVEQIHAKALSFWHLDSMKYLCLIELGIDFTSRIDSKLT